MKIDINCDLGENETPERREALMAAVTSANIACGGHAGSVETMKGCIRLAAQYGVRMGAHPGLPDRTHFGRTAQAVSAEDLQMLVLQQVSALETLARMAGLVLHHIKLHGALYHLTETNGELCNAFLHLVEECWPTTVVYALAGGQVVAQAREHGLFVWEEVFLDRAYEPGGRLVPRDQPGAVIEDETRLKARFHTLVAEKRIEAIDGTFFPVNAQTACLHGDSRIPEAALKTILRA